MQEFISQFSDIRLPGLMFKAKKMGLIAFSLEIVRHSHFAFIQIKAAMGKPHEAVGMGVSAGDDAAAAGAAKRCGTEMVLKAHAFLGQSVQIMGPERWVAITSQLLTQVVADNNQNVG